MPTDPAIRADFVARRRIGALHPEFTRAPHSRLFGTFASLGFDDHKWPSTEDLRWIVSTGRADISKLDSEVSQLLAQESKSLAAGRPFDGKTLAKSREALEELRHRVKPYEDELAARRADHAR